MNFCHLVQALLQSHNRVCHFRLRVLQQRSTEVYPFTATDQYLLVALRTNGIIVFSLSSSFLYRCATFCCFLICVCRYRELVHRYTGKKKICTVYSNQIQNMKSCTQGLCGCIRVFSVIVALEALKTHQRCHLCRGSKRSTFCFSLKLKCAQECDSFIVQDVLPELQRWEINLTPPYF